MDLLRWLYEASIPVAGYELHWLELIGVLFGLGSAIGGLVRRVWAWPTSPADLRDGPALGQAAPGNVR